MYPELVTRTAWGEVQTVKYHELIPMLVNELQREHQAHEEDRAAMALLRKELAELRALMGSQIGAWRPKDERSEAYTSLDSLPSPTP